MKSFNRYEKKKSLHLSFQKTFIWKELMHNRLVVHQLFYFLFLLHIEMEGLSYEPVSSLRANSNRDH